MSQANPVTHTDPRHHRAAFWKFSMPPPNKNELSDFSHGRRIIMQISWLPPLHQVLSRIVIHSLRARRVNDLQISVTDGDIHARNEFWNGSSSLGPLRVGDSFWWWSIGFGGVGTVCDTSINDWFVLHLLILNVFVAIHNSWRYCRADAILWFDNKIVKLLLRGIQFGTRIFWWK